MGRLLNLILLLSFAIAALHAQAAPFRVVIDPGHGGTDEGTVFDDGKIKITEKSVTLSLAQEVAKHLRTRHIQVDLTRTTDQDVPLSSRTALANRLKADVFLSIHMNSTTTPMLSDAEGIETYILNNTTDATSRRLAQLENAVLKGSKANVGSDGESNPSDVALILKDLRLDANLSESKRLACEVHTGLLYGINSALRPEQRIRSRGVRQALFYVLLGADMPSVLLEAGFLTSPRDRAYVMSLKGRTAIGRSIALAIDTFRREKNSPKARQALANCKVH